MRGKRKALLSVAVVSTLCGSVFALSDGDSLISRSYLESVFVPSAEKKASDEISLLVEGTLLGKIAELELLQEEIASLNSQTVKSTGMVGVSCELGQQLSLTQGALIVPNEGVLHLSSSGTVVNLSSGTVVSDGVLENGQQYLVAEDSTATVLVQSVGATATVLGRYSFSSTNQGEILFSDVESNQWFHDAVYFVVEENLFTGTSSDTFSPYLTMDRGMMMTVLYRLAGSPLSEMSSATATFVDVSDEDWFAPYVRWGATQKLTAGMGDGYFMAEEVVTRQQVFVMLRAFAQDYLGFDVSAVSSLTGFSDSDTVAEWATESVAWAVHSGLMEEIPSSDTLLMASEVASRAEVATILKNFYNKYL